MKLSAALTASLLALPAASAFAPTAASRGEASPRMASSLNMASSLAANQQKAAAIRAAEARNQAEIEALKAQIAQIESVFANPSTFPTLPADVSSLNSNQLQGKLSEVKSYLGTLLQRSEDNQRQVAALTGGGAVGALGAAAVAGSAGALITNALDNNRRDSINGIIAGAAGSIASSLSSPAPAPVAARAPAAPADPRANVSF